MTDPKNHIVDTPEAGKLRNVLAIVAMVAMLTIGTAVTAFAGGGVGTGGGGSGDTSGSKGGGDRYQREWNSFSAKDRKWAHNTSECESGEDPNIHSPNGDYHGAFQFLKSTWQNAPMSPGADPHRYTWKTQAVVAVKWMHKAGKDQWPVCGH
jgi:hypothetical protein